MTVVHLSTSDIKGGAARAAYRLHTGLRRLSYDSAMYVMARYSDDPSVRQYRAPMDFTSRVRRGLRRQRLQREAARYAASRPAGAEPITDDRTEYGRAIAGQLPAADVLNLHWVTGFVDVLAFLQAVSKPVVWTLHDMNAFTGGCHYDRGCGRFTARCGACPQLGSERDEDLTRAIWTRKAAALEGLRDRLRVVADSHWLAGEARRSSLLGAFPVTTIHYGLDTDDFAPRDVRFAREVWDLPQDARIVLFGAVNAESERKGFTLLRAALEGLRHVPGLHLVSFGKGRPPLDPGIPHLHLGSIQRDRLLSLVYSAADVFVIPSLQEAFGQTSLEAMACGTPVVGFDVGGIPDMVRPGETGLLAPVGDVRALQAALERLLTDDAARAAMGGCCRARVEEHFTLELQARRYAALYEQMVHPQRTAALEAASV